MRHGHVEKTNDIEAVLSLWPCVSLDLGLKLRSDFVPGGDSVEVSFFYQARHSYRVAGFVLDEPCRQDVMSRHRGAKQLRRYGLLSVILGKRGSSNAHISGAATPIPEAVLGKAGCQSQLQHAVNP